MTMKKTKKHKYEITSLLVILLIGYATQALSASYNKAINIQAEKQALEDATRRVETMTVPEMIDYIAPQYGQSPEVIKKITWCESGHKILPHDGHKGTNITGIWDSTFKSWLPLYEKEIGETLNINSQFDQIKMMSFAFSKGDEYRYQWSTYHAYVNGGKAKIWSRYYNKYIIVYCK